MSLRIGVIGYKNHAKRLVDLLDDSTEARCVSLFHPEKRSGDSRLTRKLDDLLDLDAIVVASPNNTHFPYLKELADRFTGYVFCEKPPVSNLGELEALQNLPAGFLDRNEMAVGEKLVMAPNGRQKVSTSAGKFDAFGGLVRSSS